MKLRQVGEFGLIELLTKDIKPGTGVIKGVGDDTAVLGLKPDTDQLFTTDMMVEGVHFSLRHASLRQVGIKAMTVNVSDIAAMGGRPTHAVVSVALTPALQVEDVLQLYEGIKQAAGEYSVNVVGGDTVYSPERLVINVALLGEAARGRAVYRHGARPGDLVYVTGTLGNSAAGLHMCIHGISTGSYPGDGRARLAHLEPRARLGAGILLGAQMGVTSMNDISDGLASEMNEICRASGVGCVIYGHNIPMEGGVADMARDAGIDPLTWALYGGEDFQLLFTVNPRYVKDVEKVLDSAGEDYTPIGEILPAGKGILLQHDSNRIPLEPRGYNHFNVTP